MTQMLIGLFRESSQAAAAIDELASHVDPGDISIVASESSAEEMLPIEGGTRIAGGTAIGAGVGVGGGIGAIVAGLTTVGTLTTIGVGLVAAGPLVATLAGAGAGDIGGCILGGLIGLGIPEHEVEHYEEAVEEGAVVLSVCIDDIDDEEVVHNSFVRHAAEHVMST